MTDWVGKRALLLPVLLLLGLALASCGNAASRNAIASGSTPSGSTVSPTVSTSSTTVYLSTSNFTVHAITVPVNKPVQFRDTVDGGGVHHICVGTGNGGTNTCLQSGNAPAGLLGKGTIITPGEVKEFVFTAPGTYHVICTYLKGMYINVTAS